MPGTIGIKYSKLAKILPLATPIGEHFVKYERTITTTLGKCVVVFLFNTNNKLNTEIMAQTTIIGKPDVIQKAKQILGVNDLTIFLGHCEKLTIMVGQTTTEDERKAIIEKMVGGNIPYVIKS